MLFFNFSDIRLLIIVLVEAFTVGTLSTNCYVASCPDTKEAIVIDPGLDFSSEAQPIYDYIEEAKLKIKYIVNTHCHVDHIMGNAEMKKKTGAKLVIHEVDAQKHHARHPEKDDVEGGDQHRSGIEIAGLGYVVRPSQGGKGPER